MDSKEKWGNRERNSADTVAGATLKWVSMDSVVSTWKDGMQMQKGARVQWAKQHKTITGVG